MALSVAQPIRFRDFISFKIILAREHECTRSVLLQRDMHYLGATEDGYSKLTKREDSQSPSAHPRLVRDSALVR
jgi:hypothetical protein